ncbi:MAG TPA: hypothetical protein VFG79_12720 [Solirubrobacter sp.]|nr:hypothetical protein [Solirubrobacter sp.]
MLVRRTVAALVGVVVLLILFFGVRACNDARHDNALREYNKQVSDLGTQSRNTGSEFFKLMDNAGSQPPQELYQQILSFGQEAEAALTQAEKLSVPGDMEAAQQSLLIAFQFRRDGLTKIAEKIRPALGDEGEAADKAITEIAGQMRAFDASDVLYQARVRPFIRRALDDSEIGGQTIAPSQFLPEISWLSPQFVAQQLGQQLSTTGEGNRNEPTGPGLHGTGLDATSYGNVTLQPGASNRLTYVAGQPFTVSFTNQGDNDEFNVKVTLTIARDSGQPLKLEKTVPKVAQGEKATVTLPLNRTPPLDTVVTINVVVNAVPGEEKTDNNKSSYPSLFVRG